MSFKKSILFLAVVLFSALTFAQEYPQKTVRLISPIPAGGAPDLIARAVGQRLSVLWSNPVVIENKIGSNGQVAADYVAHVAPDGYTLLVGMDSLFVINPYLYKQSNVDVNKELISIATLGANQFVLAINANLPVKNLPEFVEYAKKANPALAYASGGNGSQHHLTMELLKARADMDLLHVPYKAGAAVYTDIMGGQITCYFGNLGSAMSLIRSGKIRALAVTSPARDPKLPDVPTMVELGFPGFEVLEWAGAHVQRGTPPAIVERLAKAFQAATVVPSVRASLEKAGVSVIGSSQAEFMQFLQADYSRWLAVAKESNIRAD